MNGGMGSAYRWGVYLQRVVCIGGGGGLPRGSAYEEVRLAGSA